MYKIYDSDYNDADEGEFNAIENAARWALSYLPTDDFVYMIGTDAGIEALVFQGQVYLPKRLRRVG